MAKERWQVCTEDIYGRITSVLFEGSGKDAKKYYNENGGEESDLHLVMVSPGNDSLTDYTKLIKR